MSHATPCMRLARVCKTYGKGSAKVQALRSVDLVIEEREFVAVMGPSGSGKSTLMNILGCLDRPTSGSYQLAGREVSSLSRAELAMVRNQILGFVFQNYSLLARTSAIDNVELPLVYADVPRSERKRRAALALTRVGLAARMSNTPSELSGGQQQRVAIARALINRPRIILADEPTGNLDSRTKTEILALFQELWASGITIVYVTHEPEVAIYASRIIDMKDGVIESDRRQMPKVTTPLAAGSPSLRGERRT